MYSILFKQENAYCEINKNVLLQLRVLTQLEYPIFNRVMYYGLEKNSYQFEQYRLKIGNEYAIGNHGIPTRLLEDNKEQINLITTKTIKYLQYFTALNETKGSKY